MRVRVLARVIRERIHAHICTYIFRFCRAGRHCPRDSMGVSAASGFSTNYFPAREPRDESARSGRSGLFP